MEIGWHRWVALGSTATDPLPLELFPAVILSSPFTPRKSTPPKVVSTVADSPTVSPMTVDFEARTLIVLPTREN
jgi:hypothetical protein